VNEVKKMLGANHATSRAELHTIDGLGKNGCAFVREDDAIGTAHDRVEVRRVPSSPVLNTPIVQSATPRLISAENLLQVFMPAVTDGS
jgi:hypothetical protein